MKICETTSNSDMGSMTLEKRIEALEGQMLSSREALINHMTKILRLTNDRLSAIESRLDELESFNERHKR